MVSRRRAPRRETAWATDNINESIVSGGNSIQRLNAVLPAGQQTETTLVRSIICLQAAAVTVGIPANAMLLGAGIGVTGLEAFNTGSAAVANPSIASEEPINGWVWKCMYWLPESWGNTSPGIFLFLDIRAQRKVQNGVPFRRFEVAPGAGSPFTVRWFGIIRTLYLLP